MHCVWSQNCDTSGYHAMQAAWGVSTATWVAGTPSASMPDFTEPPEAPAVALYRLVQHCAACRMAWYGLNWFGICFWRSHTTSLSLSLVSVNLSVTVRTSSPVHVSGHWHGSFRMFCSISLHFCQETQSNWFRMFCSISLRFCQETQSNWFSQLNMEYRAFLFGIVQETRP